MPTSALDLVRLAVVERLERTALVLVVIDERPAGPQFAATEGATTKELMARLGHSSPRAVLIYQHATKDRDKTLAAALGQHITAAKDSSK